MRNANLNFSWKIKKYFIWFNIKTTNLFSGGSRIFHPEGDAYSREGCANLLFCKIFVENCMKIKEIYFPPPWIRHCCSLTNPEEPLQPPKNKDQHFLDFLGLFGNFDEIVSWCHPIFSTPSRWIWDLSRKIYWTQQWLLSILLTLKKPISQM